MKKNMVYLILLAFLLTACNKSDVKTIQNKSTNYIITDGTSKTYKNRAATGTAPDSAEPAADNFTSSERAQILSDIIMSMDGIEKASVIITGNAAIVGIVPSGEFTDQELTKYKNDVEEKVKLTDKNIKMVAVTASADLVERIEALAF